MSKTPVGIGIIGCGLMGREIASAILRYAHLLDTHAQPELRAVCDVNLDHTEWFRQNIASVGQVTDDYRDLLANSEVDAIYCAVPHHLHAVLYPDIIRAGKALLGEKPFGIDDAANRAILAAAAERPDVLVRVSSEFPYFPGAMRLAERVRSGQLGRLIEAEAGFWHSSDLDPSKPINWKRQVATNGEYGCMGDLGLHVVHLPLRLGMRLETVYAQLSNIIRQRPDAKGEMVACDTWDNAQLSVRARLGEDVFPVQFSTKRIAPGHGNTWFIRVTGTEGAVAFSTRNPKALHTMVYRPGAAQTWQREDLAYRSAYPAITGAIFEFGFSDALLQMVAAFVEEYAGHDPGFWRCVTPQEARASHVLFTGALASQQSGRAIVLDHEEGMLHA